MLSDELRIELITIHRDAFIKRGKIEPWSLEDIRFLALSLCGEAGELANLIKKEWRGDDVMSPYLDFKVREELADIVAYAALLTHAIGADVDRILRDKLPQIREKLNRDAQAA